MTVIVTFLLYYFGLNASTGMINQPAKNNTKIDGSGNIIIYDPEYNPAVNPVYYQSPNIIVPNPTANDPTVKTTPITQKTIPLKFSKPNLIRVSSLVSDAFLCPTPLGKFLSLDESIPRIS